MSCNDSDRRSEAPSQGAADTAEAEYTEALHSLAERLGRQAEELEKAVAEKADALEFTPECLTLTELERFPTFEALPKVRQTHIQNCAACSTMMAAVTPLPQEVAQFAEVATTSENRRFRFTLGVQLVAACAGVIAVVAGGYIVQLRSDLTQLHSKLNVASALVRDDAVSVAQMAMQSASMASESHPEALLKLMQRRSTRFAVAPSSAYKAGPTLGPSAAAVDRAEQLYLSATREALSRARTNGTVDIDPLLARVDQLKTVAFDPKASDREWATEYVDLRSEIASTAAASRLEPSRFTGTSGVEPSRAQSTDVTAEVEVEQHFEAALEALDAFAAIRLRRVIERPAAAAKRR